MSESRTVGFGLQDMLGPSRIERMQLPYLSLVQPGDKVSPNEAGQYHLSLLDTYMESPELTIAAVRRGRRFYLGKNRTGRPDCYSSTGVGPALAAPHPQSSECSECAYSNWTGENPPDCQEELVILGLLSPDNIPCVWPLRSTALSCWRAMHSVMVLTGGRNVNPQGYRWRLSYRSRTVGKNTFYVPTASLAASRLPTLLESETQGYLDYLHGDSDTASNSDD